MVNECLMNVGWIQHLPRWQICFYPSYENKVKSSHDSWLLTRIHLNMFVLILLYHNYVNISVGCHLGFGFGGCTHSLLVIAHWAGGTERGDIQAVHHQCWLSRPPGDTAGGTAGDTAHCTTSQCRSLSKLQWIKNKVRMHHYHHH